LKHDKLRLPTPFLSPGQVAQGALTVGLGYDHANRRTSLSYPNGTNTSYTYDVASRLTNINHLGPGGIIEALTYQYDAAGNRTSLIRNNAAASLLPAAVASASYDAANEQTAFAGATLTYDANGNLTNDGVNSYQWDARNRLIGMSGGITASFNYDVLGRRTQKTLSTPSSALSTGFLYDGNDIAAEIGGGAVGANYVRSLNIDEPFIRQSGSGNEFYHADALGSSLALSTGQGAPATTYGYEPFGKTTVTGTSTNPFQYTGRENDGTGPYYYRARYYYPILHRFLGEDPLKLDGGENSYAYVSNKPLNRKDPSGLVEVADPRIKAGGEIIAAIVEMLIVEPLIVRDRAALCASRFCKVKKPDVPFLMAYTTCGSIFVAYPAPYGNIQESDAYVYACGKECARITKTPEYRKTCKCQ